VSIQQSTSRFAHDERVVVLDAKARDRRGPGCRRGRPSARAGAAFTTRHSIAYIQPTPDEPQKHTRAHGGRVLHDLELAVLALGHDVLGHELAVAIFFAMACMTVS